MIHTLRRKLALLLIAVIATVIICTTAAALVVSERQFNSNERARLDVQVSQLVQDVRMNGIIQAPQLSKLEVANGLVISIMEEGVPIPFRGGWQPRTDREALISCALASAPEVSENWEGTIAGEHGERYLAAIRQINKYRKVRTVIVLQDMKKADSQQLTQRLIYAGIAVMALILSAFFCWQFTGWVTNPIKEAHEKQNQFVSAASHDLRSPLQVMRTNTEALKLNPPNATFFIDQILNEVSHMSRLSEDLLALTAVPDQSMLVGNPVEVAEITRNAIEYYSAAADKKEIKLSLNSSIASLPLLEGNEAMLQRAVNILVDNAICYTPQGGHVIVSTSLQGRNIVISVQDDGLGIAPEHQARIFERFYRVEQSRTDREHSGLGLSIAKQILAYHDGQLAYKPVKPHGSIFCMILPFPRIAKV